MRILLTAGVLLAAFSSVACGTDPTLSGPGSPDDAGGSGSAVISVRIEKVDGFFTEGFEVGLRFETGAGDVIASTLWSDFVTSQDDTAPDFYGSILEQRVPAGTVVIRAEANVGIGPPPSIPDLDGDLPCRLEVEMPAGGRLDLEVTFGGGDSCLSVLSSVAPAGSLPAKPIDD